MPIKPIKKTLRIALSIGAFLCVTLTASAITDEEPPDIEGTGNPLPFPKGDPEKALLSTIRCPKGMETKVFASEPNVMDPTAITFDDQNHLYIAETHRFERGVEDNRRNAYWLPDEFSLKTLDDRLELYRKFSDVRPLSYYSKYSEKIRVLQHLDGDGKCDTSNIFAEGFNDPLDGTAAGIMALDGKILLACIPNVWSLQNTDGDLVADKHESLQQGYGISISLSGHDLNGFTMGPDKRIYFTVGDRGYDLTTKEGRHLYDQYSGAVFRMERDGSGLGGFPYRAEKPQGDRLRPFWKRLLRR